MLGGSTLTAKLGPLPVWAWGAGGGAVISLGMAVAKRRHPAASATAPASGPEPASATGADGAGESFLASGTYVPPGSSSNVPSGDTTAAWIERAAQAVAGLSYVGAPSLANVRSALARWLAGQPITATESTWIMVALGAVGDPPGGAPESNVIPNGQTTDGKVPFVDVFGYDPSRPTKEAPDYGSHGSPIPGIPTPTPEPKADPPQLPPPPAGGVPNCPPGTFLGYNTVTHQYVCVDQAGNPV